MRLRALMVPVFLLGVTAAARTEPPKPNVVIQVKPIDEWLADAKHIGKELGPLLGEIGPGNAPAKAPPGVKPVQPAAAPPARDPAKMIDDAIAGILGPNWRTTIDTTKPWGGYAVLKPELTEGSAVAMLPVKDPAALLKLLANFGIKPDEKDGLYSVEVPNSPMPVLARFANGYAYIGHVPDALAKDNLLKPEDVFAAKDPSSLTVRFRLDAIPEELVKFALSALDQAVEQELGKDQPEAAKKLVRSFLDSLKMMLTDGREFTFGLDFDRKSGELAIVSEMIPKPGTALAKAYKEAEPTTSRFASLAKDAAAFYGVTYGLPVALAFENELDKTIDELHKNLTEQGIKVEKEKLEQFVKGLISALDLEMTDSALAVYTGKNGSVSILAGMRIKDGPKGEQALRDFVKELPKEFRDRIKFDAAKIGSANVHRIDWGKDMPEKARQVFGTSLGTVAVAQDVVFAALGADAEERIKAALSAPAGPAPMVIFAGSVAKFWPIAEAVAEGPEREQVRKVRQLLGQEVDKLRLVQLTRTPGESIKYRFGVDLVTIVKVASAIKAVESTAPKVAESKENRVYADVTTLSTACMAYKLKFEEFPSKLDQLLKPPDGSKPFIEKADALNDPWGKRYQYDPSGTNSGGRKPDIWTETPEKKKIGNWMTKPSQEPKTAPSPPKLPPPPKDG